MFSIENLAGDKVSGQAPLTEELIDVLFPLKPCFEGQIHFSIAFEGSKALGHQLHKGFLPMK